MLQQFLLELGIGGERVRFLGHQLLDELVLFRDVFFCLRFHGVKLCLQFCNPSKGRLVTLVSHLVTLQQLAKLCNLVLQCVNSRLRVALLVNLALKLFVLSRQACIFSNHDFSILLHLTRFDFLARG